MLSIRIRRRRPACELEQLLWVRCRNMDQALRATDLLMQGGGFGMIALDLSDIPPETVRYVPLNVWFRFRRAVEDTPTIFMVLEQESNAKTCASLVLRMGDAGRGAGGKTSSKRDRRGEVFSSSVMRVCGWVRRFGRR